METASSASGDFLVWLLLLLGATVGVFMWRCYRAGVLAAFGRRAPSSGALWRLGVAACVPAFMCAIWLAFEPSTALWAAGGMLHLALSWYGLAWLLPDHLTRRSEPGHG